MRTRLTNSRRASAPTLADLIATVSQLTHNERLSAFIVADMINSELVRLEGSFHGHRVIVA